MKTILLGGLTALAVSTAPMVASAADYTPEVPQVSGDLSVYGLWSHQHIVEDGGTENHSGDAFGGLARGNWWWTENMNAQLEFSGEAWNSSESDGVDQEILDGAVHLDWGHQDDGLIGVFGSVGSNTDFSRPATFATGALEAQETWGPFTLYGQIGYSSSIGGGGADTENSAMDGVYGHAAARFELTPGINLGAEGGYAALTVDEKSLEIIRWGASIDGMIPNTPLGLFLKYQGHYDDIHESGDKVTVHAVLAGVTLFFNGDSTSNMRVDYNPFTGVSTPRDAY